MNSRYSPLLTSAPVESIVLEEDLMRRLLVIKRKFVVGRLWTWALDFGLRFRIPAVNSPPSISAIPSSLP